MSEVVGSIESRGQPRSTRPGALAPDPQQTIAKISRRLIPFLVVLYIVNYIDRSNVAMAKLRMLADTGISDKAYGLGAGLFFIGYFLFEVPSNLILERVGARIWMARIMISWGIVSTGMMFVRGSMSFYLLRLLLGIAEAGFLPGIMLYFTYWVPSRYRAGVISWFLTSTALSGVIGNPLAGVLMKLDNIGGLHGWQWLFLIEGILPFVLGIAILFLLPDRPADANWLSAAECEWIERKLDAERRAHPEGHVAEMAHALRSGRLWLLSVNYYMLIMGLFGFMYWVPSVVDSVWHGSTVSTGLLTAIPYFVATVTIIFIGRNSDRKQERRWHVAFSALTAASGFALVPLAVHTNSTPLVLTAWCIAAIGIWGTLGPFWALTSAYLRAGAAAGGIAIVNSIGSLAGFVAPYLIGWLKDRTGSFAIGMLIVAASLVCGAILVLQTPGNGDRGDAAR